MEAGALLFSDFPRALSARRGLHLGVCAHCDVAGAPIDASHKRRLGAQSICSDHVQLPPPLKFHCSEVVSAFGIPLRWNVAIQRLWPRASVHFLRFAAHKSFLPATAERARLFGDLCYVRLGRRMRSDVEVRQRLLNIGPDRCGAVRWLKLPFLSSVPIRLDVQQRKRAEHMRRVGRRGLVQIGLVELAEVSHAKQAEAADHFVFQ